MPKNTISLAADTTRIPDANFYDLRNIFPSAGNIWAVDSGSANPSAATGRSPDYAVLTIDAAINLATANNGDIIAVLEGHAESITAANGIAADVAGITIIGLGRGRNSPMITFTTAVGASVNISAQNVHIENLKFICNIDDQTAMINVSATDSRIRNCEFQIADATYDAEAGIIYTDAAGRFILEDCHFHQTGNAAVAAPITFGACDNGIIRRCNIQGYHGTAGAIINGAAAANILIDGNIIVNRTADAENKAIVLHASTVGMISNNRMAIIDSTAPAPVTAAAAFVSGNYYTGAVGVAASTLM